MGSKYIALIPAYEPDQILLTILAQLREAGFDVVVVDDGSGPDYSHLFVEASFTAAVLTHRVNKGKGSALKTGLSYIREHFDGKCIITTMDADGQHCVEDAIELCRLVQQYPDALILGSRGLKENVPLRSRVGNTVTRAVYQSATGLHVHDTQTGLRAFSFKLLPELLAVSGERYEYEMNVLLEFARKGIPIREKEIRTIYIDNNASSHFDTLWDSVRVYKEIIRFSASSFIGFLTDYAMYSLLLVLTDNLLYSNIGARIVSASVNYTINRRFVFRSKRGIVKSAVQYFLLAAVILFGNTMILKMLVDFFGVHQMIAKILTELLFFVFSWLIQRLLIFRQEKVHGRQP